MFSLARQSPKFKLYSFAPLTDTAPPTAAGTAPAPPTVAPDPKSGFTFVEVDTFKEVSCCWKCCVTGDCGGVHCGHLRILLLYPHHTTKVLHMPRGESERGESCQ